VFWVVSESWVLLAAILADSDCINVGQRMLHLRLVPMSQYSLPRRLPPQSPRNRPVFLVEASRARSKVGATSSFSLVREANDCPTCRLARHEVLDVSQFVRAATLVFRLISADLVLASSRSAAAQLVKSHINSGCGTKETAEDQDEVAHVVR
jgi:hypothetical protein